MGAGPEQGTSGKGDFKAKKMLPRSDSLPDGGRFLWAMSSGNWVALCRKAKDSQEWVKDKEERAPDSK